METFYHTQYNQGGELFLGRLGWAQWKTNPDFGWASFINQKQWGTTAEGELPVYHLNGTEWQFKSVNPEMCIAFFPNGDDDDFVFEDDVGFEIKVVGESGTKTYADAANTECAFRIRIQSSLESLGDIYNNYLSVRAVDYHSSFFKWRLQVDWEVNSIFGSSTWYQSATKPDYPRWYRIYRIGNTMSVYESLTGIEGSYILKFNDYHNGFDTGKWRLQIDWQSFYHDVEIKPRVWAEYVKKLDINNQPAKKHWAFGYWRSDIFDFINLFYNYAGLGIFEIVNGKVYTKYKISDNVPSGSPDGTVLSNDGDLYNYWDAYTSWNGGNWNVLNNRYFYETNKIGQYGQIEVDLEGDGYSTPYTEGIVANYGDVMKWEYGEGFVSELIFNMPPRPGDYIPEEDKGFVVDTTGDGTPKKYGMPNAKQKFKFAFMNSSETEKDNIETAISFVHNEITLNDKIRHFPNKNDSGTYYDCFVVGDVRKERSSKNSKRYNLHVELREA